MRHFIIDLTQGRDERQLPSHRSTFKDETQFVYHIVVLRIKRSLKLYYVGMKGTAATTPGSKCALKRTGSNIDQQ